MEKVEKTMTLVEILPESARFFREYYPKAFAPNIRYRISDVDRLRELSKGHWEDFQKALINFAVK